MPYMGGTPPAGFITNPGIGNELTGNFISVISLRVPTLPQKKAAIVPLQTGSTVDWSQCRLVQGGWTVRQDHTGYTVTGSLYANSPHVFPHRGDKLQYVAGNFANFYVSEVEVVPLTSEGPFVANVTARPTLLENDSSGSLKREHSCELGISPYPVYGPDLKGHPWDDTRTRECHYCKATWYTRGRGEPITYGKVRYMPSWTRVEQPRDWVIESATAQVVRDTDGTSTLRKVSAIFISPTGYDWNPDKFPEVSFDSI